MNVLHIADVHLGHRQYNVVARERDMVSSFRYALGQTDSLDADLVVIPGDLFHERDLRPEVIEAAEGALATVDVPVLVSPGNHDENLTPRNITWLEYLHRHEYITLLQARVHEEGPLFVGPDAVSEECPGYVDVHSDELDGPIRFFGLQYRGGYIDQTLEDVGQAITEVNAQQDTPAYTVLLAHFGVEDEVPGLGANVTHAELTPIESVVDYLALGHIHKPFQSGGWIYNPGSLEVHNTQEARWDHGMYLAAFGPEGIEADHKTGKRRPFYQYEFDVSGYATADELERDFRSRCQTERDDVDEMCTQPEFTQAGDRRPPVIDLRLTGHLEFDRRHLDIDTLKTIAADELDALHVQPQVGVTTSEVTALLDELDESTAFTEQGTLRTAALEAEVFTTIAEQSAYEDRAEDVAAVLGEVRELATNEDTPVSEVADLVQSRRRSMFPDGAAAEDESAAPEEPVTGGDAE